VNIEQIVFEWNKDSKIDETELGTEAIKIPKLHNKYMMFFMALMFFKVPCGLCLYFIASSLWGIAERLLLPTTKPGSALAGAGGPTIVDAVSSRPADRSSGGRKRRKRR